jgi:signal peptidase I
MEDILYHGKETVFRYRGKSMHPTLKEGMNICAEEVPVSSVRRGDIILYKSGSSLAAHRVIKILKEGAKTIFVTKGDNHAYVDADLIPESGLIARVKAAFSESEPGRDVLIKSGLIPFLYVIIGNTIFWIRKNREVIPAFLRNILKPIVGGFSLVLKKTIHFLSLFSKK